MGLLKRGIFQSAVWKIAREHQCSHLALLRSNWGIYNANQYAVYMSCGFAEQEKALFFSTADFWFGTVCNTERQKYIPQNIWYTFPEEQCAPFFQFFAIQERFLVRCVHIMFSTVHTGEIIIFFIAEYDDVKNINFEVLNEHLNSLAELVCND